MASIDVAIEVVLDGVVAATGFQVVRRMTWVDPNGGFEKERAVVIPGLVGSVTPTGDNSFIREAEWQAQARTLLVITRFLLRAVMEDLNGVQWQPDLVLFQGGYYIVKTVEGYGQIGGGFVAAYCEAFSYDINGTQGPPPVYGAEDYRKGVYTALLGAFPWL